MLTESEDLGDKGAYCMWGEELDVWPFFIQTMDRTLISGQVYNVMQCLSSTFVSLHDKISN